MGRTKNIADAIRAEMAADPALAEAIEAESFNADLAMKVYELREKAGLTQKQLAERIGTQQSVISRIEDADYEGHSLNVLKRIAHALGAKLRVEFVFESEVHHTAITVTIPLSWANTGSLIPYTASATGTICFSGSIPGHEYHFTPSALVLR